MTNRFNFMILIGLDAFLGYLAMYLNSQGNIFYYPILGLLILGILSTVFVYLALKIKTFRESIKYFWWKVRGRDE